jgi:poly(A) polymerase Pap1
MTKVLTPRVFLSYFIMAVNSSYNVGIPQQRRIQEEFHRAVLLMGKEEKNWRSIYYPTNFFERHANYLVITIR